MAEDTTALIEEARKCHGDNNVNGCCWNCEQKFPCTVARLADALEASEAELRRLREGVQELELDLPFAGFKSVDDEYPRGYRHAQDDIKRRLLSLLGDSQKQGDAL